MDCIVHQLEAFKFKFSKKKLSNELHPLFLLLYSTYKNKTTHDSTDWLYTTTHDSTDWLYTQTSNNLQFINTKSSAYLIDHTLSAALKKSHARVYWAHTHLNSSTQNMRNHLIRGLKYLLAEISIRTSTASRADSINFTKLALASCSQTGNTHN